MPCHPCMWASGQPVAVSSSLPLAPLGVELTSSGLASRAFTCQAITLALKKKILHFISVQFLTRKILHGSDTQQLMSRLLPIDSWSPECFLMGAVISIHESQSPQEWVEPLDIIPGNVPLGIGTPKKRVLKACPSQFWPISDGVGGSF